MSKGEDDWLPVSSLRKVLEGPLWAVVNMVDKEATQRMLENCRLLIAGLYVSEVEDIWTPVSPPR